MGDTFIKNDDHKMSSRSILSSLSCEEQDDNANDEQRYTNDKETLPSGPPGNVALPVYDHSCRDAVPSKVAEASALPCKILSPTWSAPNLDTRKASQMASCWKPRKRSTLSTRFVFCALLCNVASCWTRIRDRRKNDTPNAHVL